MNKRIIGKNAEVLSQGRRFIGTIIDESKNMIHLKTKEGNKRFIKTEVTLKIDETIINGKKITKRPEERIKW